jgi:hypothetical protein
MVALPVLLVFASSHHPLLLFAPPQHSIFNVINTQNSMSSLLINTPVLSTALFDQPAFRNNIVNGMVLAADGQKMSKRKKNYPPPMVVLQKYGADALRMYLVNCK